MKKSPEYILPIIVIAQFCCTSLWFASNAVLVPLTNFFLLPRTALGNLTTAVQLGFISGTLLFAIFTIADKYSPSKVFFLSAVLAALFNFGMLWNGNSFETLVVLRFFTGFFLAGIYPVGMKIAADYFDKGLGKSLGYLVGALVLGTSFPHFIKSFISIKSWEPTIVITSCIAILGGLLVLLLVPNGPFRKSSQVFKLTAFLQVFKNPEFKSAAFGYFGHMWELYTFWAFVPVLLMTYKKLHIDVNFSVSLWSFLIIAIGSLGCILGGYVSKKIGTKKTARNALLFSGICCIISPFAFQLNEYLFLGFLLFWGFMVVADSPLFSTLVAKNAIASYKGTALTIVNCIGFSITVISLQWCSFLYENINPIYLLTFLAIGPAFGLMYLFHKSSLK